MLLPELLSIFNRHVSAVSCYRGSVTTTISLPNNTTRQHRVAVVLGLDEFPFELDSKTLSFVPH